VSVRNFRPLPEATRENGCQRDAYVLDRVVAVEVGRSNDEDAPLCVDHDVGLGPRVLQFEAVAEAVEITGTSRLMRGVSRIPCSSDVRDLCDSLA